MGTETVTKPRKTAEEKFTEGIALVHGALSMKEAQLAKDGEYDRAKEVQKIRVRLNETTVGKLRFIFGETTEVEFEEGGRNNGTFY